MKLNIESYLSSLKKIAKRNRVILENFSYITLMQMLLIVAPLITYPYLTRVLGTKLYGTVLTAQVLASYATIIVRFGFDSVSARHISMHMDNKEKLSEVMSSIMTMRGLLWIACAAIYIAVVLAVPVYREHFLLFLFSYGLTINVLLFPQFYFQGIEQMKFITLINVGIQALFVVLTFIVIKSPNDYIYVPLLHAVGYLIGGVAALFIIFHSHRIKFRFPQRSQALYYVKDAAPLFATDAVCTIKDKFNYLLIGVCVSMSEVVPYDVGAKLTSLSILPLTIINTVVFPKMARDKSNRQFRMVGLVIVTCIVTLVLLINIFLRPIVHFLIGCDVDLFPIRLYLLSPIFLGLSSYTASSLIVARGHNRYMLYSILITTGVYLVLLIALYLTYQLTSITSFIILTVVSYFAELIYRLAIGRKIICKENIR